MKETRVNFYMKEVVVADDSEEQKDEITITVIKRGGNNRSQLVNSKMLDDLTATEQQTIKAAVAIVEKYRALSEGAQDMKYSL